MRFAPLCVCALLAIASRAQVPTGFLLVAEDGSNASPGLRYVDPSTGVVTPLRVLANSNGAIARVAGVGLDAQNPTILSTVGGLSTSISAGFQRVQVQGSLVPRVTSVAVQGPGAIATRLEVTAWGTLLAVPTGSLPGLWLLPNTGNLASPLHLLPRTYEVTAYGSSAYAASYTAGQPSTIIAADLVTAQTRTLGTTYAAIRALLAGVGGSLVAGTDDGNLLLIDTTTGNAAVMASLGVGPIVAITGELGATIYALNASSEVHAWPGGVAPVYRSTNRVNDIAWGNVDLASLLFHGTPCASTGTAAARFAYTSEPSLGNINFALAMSGGLPSAPAVLMIGTSRTSYLNLPLPIDLTFLDMPGCSLYTDVVTSVPLTLNAGGGASLGLPVPSAQIFRGSRIDAQWFHLDVAANLRGLAATDGAEGILR